MQGTRLLAWLFTASLAAGTVAGPAEARPPRLKAVKEALVRVEERIDGAKSALGSLRAESGRIERELAAARSRLFPPPVGAGLLAGLEFAGEVVTLAGLSTERERLARATRRASFGRQSLTFRRERKIDELEDIVVRASSASGLDRGSRGTLDRETRSSLVTYSAAWEEVARCESSGDWGLDARFDGGLQFHPVTWIEFGGGELARYAHRATKLEQIAIAERVLAIQGPRAWPNCFHALPFHF